MASALSTFVVPAAGGASGTGNLAASRVLDASVAVGAAVGAVRWAGTFREGLLAGAVPALGLGATAWAARFLVLGAGTEFGAVEGTSGGARVVAGFIGIGPAARVLGACGLAGELLARTALAVHGCVVVPADAEGVAAGDIIDIGTACGASGAVVTTIGGVGVGEAIAVSAVPSAAASGAASLGVVGHAGEEGCARIDALSVSPAAAGGAARGVLLELAAERVDAEAVHVGAVRGADAADRVLVARLLGGVGLDSAVSCGGRGASGGGGEGYPLAAAGGSREVLAVHLGGGHAARDELGHLGVNAHVHGLVEDAAVGLEAGAVGG